MNKLKKIIIILIILMIIIISVLLFLNYKNIHEEASEDSNEIYDSNEEDAPEKENEKNQNGFIDVDDKVSYFTVASCIEEYLKYFNENYTMEMTQQEKKLAIFNMLSENYIKDNEIDLNNVYDKIKIYNNDIEFLVKKEMVMNCSESVDTYIIEGLIYNEKNVQTEFFMVNLCPETQTFSINPIDKENYTNINDIKLTKKISKIKENDYNTYIEVGLEEKSLAEEYLYYYKKAMLYFKDEAYRLLDQEYSESRFGEIYNFNKYLKDYNESIEEIELSRYKTELYENYEEITCKDQYGNYYIFEDKGTGKFQVKLDTYTIEKDDYKTKYLSQEIPTKARMNIENINLALNRSDYRYIYNKLNNNFKENNFKTLTDFESYMDNNFFKLNSFEYGDIINQKNGCIYEIKIKDASEKNDNVIEKNFNIELGEGTDFTMSFNIE